MGVYEAARQLKIRIPEDLSVIGFDDIQTAAYMGPALTTVRQPLQDMAATAARMVIDTNEGRQDSEARGSFYVFGGAGQHAAAQITGLVQPSERHRFLACLENRSGIVTVNLHE